MSESDLAPDTASVSRATLYAAARTVMANERTTLSFVKTGLGLLLTGAGLLKLYGHPLLQLAGWAALGLAVLITASGLMRYSRLRFSIGGRKELHQLAQRLEGRGERTRQEARK